jgi:hypothetical protein
MDCRQCASSLSRPGDFCLTCRTENADAVVVAVQRDRATLSILAEESVLGETTVTTVPETGELARCELRNFAGRIADEIRRKRPEIVYATGVRAVIREIRARIQYECYRIDGEDPVEAALQSRGNRALDVVETPPAEKIGGSHTTLIGGRDGQLAVQTVAEHPHVKKIVPGPIEAGGASSQSGLRAKATRADETGNVRLLLRDGSSVQENRIVTTARDVESGERVRAALNDALAAAEFK